MSGNEERTNREEAERGARWKWAVAGPAGRMRIAREAKGGSEEEERAARTAHLNQRKKRPVGLIAAFCTVGFLILAGAISVYWWEFLKSEGEAIRNIALAWAALAGVCWAVWRSVVAAKQAETGEGSLLDARYQRAVEMLGHDFLSVRIGGIHALRNLAFEYPQYDEEVTVVLNLYARGKRWKPTIENTEVGIKVPADEWEAEEAAQALYEAKKRRERTSQQGN